LYAFGFVHAHVEAQHVRDFAHAHWPEAGVSQKFGRALDDEVLAIAARNRGNAFKKRALVQLVGFGNQKTIVVTNDCLLCGAKRWSVFRPSVAQRGS
jgi:hypothetical protein